MFPHLSPNSADRVLTDLDFDDIRIRRAGEADAEAIRRLALLDSRPAPSGQVLVAEARGELLAAVGRGGTRLVADPFRPTADVARLLELRAAQLWGARPRRVRMPGGGRLRAAEARV